MDTTTTQTTHAKAAPKELVSSGTRLLVAACVAGVLFVGWTGVKRESRHAVEYSSAALERTYITLPSVLIVAGN